MKCYLALLTVFVLVNREQGIVKNYYEGQSQEAVEKMLINQGLTYTIVNEAIFKATPDKTPPTQQEIDVLAAKKQVDAAAQAEINQAIAQAKDDKADPSIRLNALIKGLRL